MATIGKNGVAPKSIINNRHSKNQNGFTKKLKQKLKLKSFSNSFDSIRNWCHDLIWPTPAILLLYLYIFWLIITLGNCNDYPNSLESLLISWAFTLLTFSGFVITRQLLIRRLLSYHGWIFGDKSPKTKIWGIFLKILLFGAPSKRLYSAQRILPRIPVPCLDSTLKTLVDCHRGILSEEEVDALAKEAKEFKNKIGWKLQLLLKIKSWISPNGNYITGWWSEFIYLRSRESLLTSNVAGFCQSYWKPTDKQNVRAAVLTYLIARTSREISRGEFHPVSIAKTIPLCSHFYRRLYSTVRVPGRDIDRLEHFSPSQSRHIVVNSKGFLYKLTVFNSEDNILVPEELLKQFNWISQDSESRSEQDGSAESSPVRCLPALTTLPRGKWAEIREEYLINSRINAKSLREIESAIVCLLLSPDKLPTLTDHCYVMSLADGKSIWYDKSLNFIVTKDAFTGFNLEHSLTDGSQIAHVWEEIMCEEGTTKLFTESGECMPFPINPHPQGEVVNPSLLDWEVGPEFEAEINNAVKFSQNQNLDIEMESFDFSNFGKEQLKKVKVGPDAFFQAAIALAFYRDIGKMPNTYEPSLMRLFLEGRTETIRAHTPELNAFILAFENEEISKEEKVALFKKSVAAHQRLSKLAMTGKGIDRHLFALLIAGKYLKYDVSFLEKIFDKPFDLITSQVPGDQIAKPLDLKHDYFKGKHSMGGIFTIPKTAHYGVGYFFGSQFTIFYQLSSCVSNSKTNTKRYSKEISKALIELMELIN